MTMRHVVLAKRKLTTYVYAIGGSLQSWYQSGFPAFQVHNLPTSATVIVLLVSRCLARDSRLWWMTLGERAMSGDSWAEFRALIIARYGPLPNEDADLPYRDPEIYNDMYLGQYLSNATDWRAYLNESMGQYCRRFQDAMLPYNLIFVPAPMTGITMEHMINDIMEAEIIAHMLQVDALVDDIMQVPVDDAGIPEPLFKGGPFLPEDPIPVVPLQEILLQEAEADAEGNEVDPTDFMAAPEDQPEHPPVIIIDSDDDEEDVEEEIEEQWEEQEQGVWEEEIEDFVDDPEEILFDDGDWDVDSDASSVITIEQID
ncbi:hypothetical protein TIFTF001_028467 [Ficus carica]|uniref:Uncharacterized protein n=1 Tax=Ficus carica TaxID=3494 RepID=A0AA88IWL2_FICCA|nr:hypothetical protein TIFTF001_028467 [Ficus carica]